MFNSPGKELRPMPSDNLAHPASVDRHIIRKIRRGPEDNSETGVRLSSPQQTRLCSVEGERSRTLEINGKKFCKVSHTPGWDSLPQWIHSGIWKPIAITSAQAKYRPSLLGYFLKSWFSGFLSTRPPPNSVWLASKIFPSRKYGPCAPYRLKRGPEKNDSVNSN